ncbi:MAG: NAD(P)/FAD-dependent oxidoreductase [Clostridiales Family XIII bacterium]|jgi:thioredoxin reductase|nr:NAD(P)/FAD-dependent oxidoreductase [Clostridiales Family XIII bacterium]
MVERDIVVVGAGPAGLAAAIEAAKLGAKSVLVVDLNMKAGGQLFKQIHKFFGSSAHGSGVRGIDIGAQMLADAQKYGVEIWLNSAAVGIYGGKVVSIEKNTENKTPVLTNVVAKKIVIAVGASENVIRFKGWTKPGVMGAGAAQTMINVNRVRPGKRIVMLGSGNVGLIVSYQLMQAGCEVVALVEALPGVGGYGVHASKIKRAGVPIYTKHTIIEAKGGDRVEAVVIAEIDKNFAPIAGTEKTLEADTITLAAGLKPISDLVRLSEAELVFDGVLGGWIPKHDRNMETTASGIYVAGDATGVEEANTALEEGKLAGVAAAESLGLVSESEAGKLKGEIWYRLDGLRMGPFGEKRMKAKAAQIASFPGVGA